MSEKVIPENLEDCHPDFIEWFKENPPWGGPDLPDHSNQYDVFLLGALVGKSEGAEDEMTLRKMIWLNHGCGMTTLYGDDGEMQCNHCLIDFKRDSVVSIHNTFQKIGMAKLAAHQLGTELDIKPIAFQHRAENAPKKGGSS